MSLRRIAMVAWLDLRHNLRRPIFWFLLAIILFLTWGLSSGNAQIGSGDSSVGGTKAWLTSEFAVGQILSILVLMIYAFFVAVVAGMPMIRDGELKVGELLHSTLLRPGEYVWGRFLAVSLSFLVILGVHLLAMMTVYHWLPRASMDEMRGPLVLMNYVRPAVFLGLPTIVFIGGTSFALGTLTRKPILVFFLPVVLIIACGFFLWNWSPSWLSPTINRVLMLIDPGGYRWLNETYLKVDRGVEFYNETPIGYGVLFMTSRVIMVLLGLGAVVLAQWRFAVDVRGARHGVAATRTEPDDEAASSGTSIRELPPLADLRMRTRSPGPLRGTLAVARFELRELRHHPGLYLFAPLILIQTIGTMLFAVGAFSTPLLQTPGTLAVATMNTLTLLVCLLLQFYTVESVQRDRNTGAAAIIYATPIRSIALLFGKAIANTMVGAVILVATLIACLLVLLVQGTVPITIQPFMLVWGAILIPTFLLWSAFVMAVAALARNRYTTHAICLAALMYTGYKQMVGEMSWVGNWDAWSVVGWSDMGPLAFNGFALAVNRLMVLALMAFFLALAVKFFSRRDWDSARTMHRLRPAALLWTVLKLLPVAAVPIVLGVFLWTEVLAGFQGERAENDARDYWKENLATWHDALNPVIADADIKLELEPARRWFRTAGRYELVNPRDEPLAKIALTGGLHWENVQWTMNGQPHEPEDRARLYVFTPPTPLGRDERVTIGFTFDGHFPKGITKNGGGSMEFILSSGVVLTSFSPSFVPSIGYQESIGVDEDNSYESRVYPMDHYEGLTEPALGGARPFDTRIEITGPQEYTYNSVGVKTSDVVEDGLRTVVWESDHPVAFFNVVAGRWDVREGTNTRVFYHPGHTYNIDQISEALDAALVYYSQWFHPYPWSELKLSEFPNLATYAQGFATNITFSERIGFLTKSDSRSNAAFMVTAHEAAHQWWGNILMPGEGPGSNVLVEGTAHFSTILLTDQVRGLHERIELCKRLEESYGDTRVADSERPLILIDGSRPGDTTVTYDKGGWVFWMVLNLMGREACLEGVQGFIDHYKDGPDYPLIQDFIAYMGPYAPDSDAFDAFTDEWFFQVIVPEYRLSDASVERSGDTWEVTVTVENPGTGRMPVEIAATRGERFDEDGQPTAKYRDSRVTTTLGAGETETVVIRCDFEPDAVIVDPDALVLQLKREAAVTGF